MGTGAEVVKNGYNLMLNRGFTASPTVSAVTKFGIGTGTTTPTTSDTVIETPIVTWSSGSSYKSYYSTPVFVTANQNVTTYGYVASTEANGNVITEYGDFNTDGTPVLFSHIVFTGITKTSAIQIYFETTYKRS